MPPQAELSAKQLTTIILVTGLLAGAIAGLIDYAIPDKDTIQSEEPSDPDERPPVIINNGSITFEPQGGSGDWDGSDKTYKHKHTYLPPTALRIIATGGGNPHVCTHSTMPGRFAPPFTTVVPFTVAFGVADEGQWETATVSLDGGSLKVDFTVAPELIGKTLVRFKDNNAVAVRRLIVGPAGNQYTCTFDNDKTKLRIRQLK